MVELAPNRTAVRRWIAYATLLGLYLTFRGYHCRDGDQAYRLPLLMHQQDPGQFANDPFVRALDQFNPHRGYLWLLDVASRPFGLSAALAGLFVLTFACTCAGIDRLARTIWPESGPAAALVAIGMVLAAQAGNVGTNHLFEPILLDRLMAYGLGWLSLSFLIADSRGNGWIAAVLLGLAGLIHPSLGLQLGLLCASAAVAWGLLSPQAGISLSRGLGIALLLAIGLVPSQALIAGQGGVLFRGLPIEELRILTGYIQSPQHLMPHLWRLPQWLAFACYPLLALLTASGWGLARCLPTRWTEARVRFGILLLVDLAALLVAWGAIEGIRDARATIFQPFRMATVARGLTLIVLAGRIVALAREQSRVSWCRVGVLAIGLTADWSLVVAAAGECAASAAIRFAPRLAPGAWPAVLGSGMLFLAWHDTHAGYATLSLGVAAGYAAGWLFTDRSRGWSVARLCRLAALAWMVPLGLGLVSLLPAARRSLGQSRAEALLGHCRFAETPVGDFERLALWCRGYTPAGARFVGPPGPKTFRLWSHRALAFNQAGSPYHADGLADWAGRYRDHIRFEGTLAQLTHLHIHARLPLERRYDEMSDRQRAELARRQGATYVVGPAPTTTMSESQAPGPLELLHVEGRYAVYRLRPLALASAGTG